MYIILDRNYSLKKNKEFSYVYRRGKSVANKNLVLIYVKKRTDGLKIGFSVSKKVGNAVVRNLTKRRLKEAFSSIMDDVEKNTLIVFIARPTITSLDYQGVLKNVKHVLKRADLFIDKPKKKI